MTQLALIPDPMPRMQRAAVLSDCSRYRYHLERVWDPDGKRVAFLMLNPSTADHRVDDPTTRKCLGFVERWGGFGAIDVVNLFAHRATDPAELRDEPAFVGPENDNWLRDVLAWAALVVVAWGAHPIAERRAREVAARFTWLPLFCLGTSASGAPRHPLMLSYATEREPWRPR